jgi:glucosamine--fructose-6-phosphate aminotransferase (isomerizing)
VLLIAGRDTLAPKTFRSSGTGTGRSFSASLRRPKRTPLSSKADVFLEEIRQQPEALARLLKSDEVERAGQFIAERQPHLVRLAAHGSSRHAATYASYLIMTELGLRAGVADLSALLAHHSSEPFNDDMVLALSQSGETADVVEYVTRARARGAATIAITNDARSPLAAASERSVALLAGPERAIPATKTYTNQLLASALLVSHASGSDELISDLMRIPDLVEKQIAACFERAAEVADALLPARRMVVLGGGYEYATAREIALKLIEAAAMPTTAISPLEALHGHLAALRAEMPVLIFASRGPLFDELRAACRSAVEYGATVVAIGDAAEELEPDFALPVTPIREALAPILTVIAGQLLTYHLAARRNLDSANPPGLAKIVSLRPTYLDAQASRLSHGGQMR